MKQMDEKQMTLGTDYDGENPAGWFMSEKLDGCRAYWDGIRFWTRGGEIIKAPAWFTKGLPPVHLDGEIYAGRGQLQAARLATQYGGRHFTRKIRFVVFDRPQSHTYWPYRLSLAGHELRKDRYASSIPFIVCDGYAHLFSYLNKIQTDGGEGVMLRHPHVTSYEIGRTKNLLKVKAAHPAMFV